LHEEQLHASASEAARLAQEHAQVIDGGAVARVGVEEDHPRRPFPDAAAQHDEERPGAAAGHDGGA
jgi:hypothetical protein